MNSAESQWNRAETPESLESLVAAGYSEALAALLGRRKISTGEEAARYLSPSLDQLHDPMLLDGMSEAVGLLLEQRSDGLVMIVGDYDVDGISSAALVTATLGAVGVASEAVLPHRRFDGYGLQPQHVDRALERGATVLLTLDCGTTAYEAVGLAVASGLSVIVVDHHLPGEQSLPDAILVNPQQPTCLYPFDELAAAGLSLKLAMALCEEAQRDVPTEALLRIACLGTIADMVPLVDENRVIASLGLRALEKTRSLGLQAMFREARIQAPFDASDVGYRIGPRLNAAGRLDSAEPALELLLTRDPDRATKLAKELERNNSDRRAEELRVVEAAEARVEARDSIPPIIVEWDESWNRGVVGIAASRLARKFRRPTILLQVEGTEATGSGRSVSGIHLFDFLQRWSAELPRFGGHAQAIGLSLETGRLEGLRSEWEAAAEEWPAETRQRLYEYELQLEPGDIHLSLWREFAQLEPYGMANPKPLLRVGPMTQLRTRQFGKGHLRVWAEGRDRRKVTLLGWNWADRSDVFSGEFEVLGNLERDRYNGGVEIQIVEVRPIV